MVSIVSTRAAKAPRHPPSPAPILLATTGGTIATTAEPDGSTAPKLTAEDLASKLDAAALTDVEVEEWASVPSWTLGPPEMRDLALRIRDAARSNRWSGIVVTHGTTTMEYTAFLTDLFLDVETSVVFTGAMRRSDDPAADGPANLTDALALARHEPARSLGAVICFAGKVFAARDAHKSHRDNDDAFESLEGLLGEIKPEGIVLHRVPTRPDAFGGTIEPSVALVKAYPGADDAVIELVIDRGAKGVVIEALPGAGGIPPRMQPAIERHAGEGVPIVIASRAPRGRLPSPPTGGTGSPLAALGVLSAGTLTAEKSWILLMACLGEAKTIGEAKELFTKVADPTIEEERVKI